MRHLLIGLLALLLFLLVATYASSYGWAADPDLYAIPDEPEVEIPLRPPVPKLAPRRPFSLNTLYDGRTQRVAMPRQDIALTRDDEDLEEPSIYDEPAGTNATGNISRWTQTDRGIYDPLRGRERLSINPVERALTEQGYDVAGKLPILPQKRDARITDAAGNVLPSRDPVRNMNVPIIGNQRTTRDILSRNRLSATERTQQQLYRGPSRPGMIAPRAQQERLTPSARDLGRRPN